MAWKSGESHSTDLRSRVLAALDGGSPARAVASLFQSASPTSTSGAGASRRATDETEARPQRNQLDAQAGGTPCCHRSRGGAPAGRGRGGAEGPVADHAPGHGAPRADAQDARPPRAYAQENSQGGPRSRAGPTSPGSVPPGVAKVGTGQREIAIVISTACHSAVQIHKASEAAMLVVERRWKR